MTSSGYNIGHMRRSNCNCVLGHSRYQGVTHRGSCSCLDPDPYAETPSLSGHSLSAPHPGPVDRSITVIINSLVGPRRCSQLSCVPRLRVSPTVVSQTRCFPACVLSYILSTYRLPSDISHKSHVNILHHPTYEWHRRREHTDQWFLQAPRR